MEYTYIDRIKLLKSQKKITNDIDVSGADDYDRCPK